MVKNHTGYKNKEDCLSSSCWIDNLGADIKELSKTFFAEYSKLL